MDGTNVKFSVTAEGVGLTFQWQKNSLSITDTPGVYTGTNTNTLTIESAGQTDEGEYSVIVSNGAGPVTSASASLRTCMFLRMYTLSVHFTLHSIFLLYTLNF